MKNIASSRGIRARRLTALGVSGMALAAGLATPASAQCAPDPARPDTVNCTGTDSDGYTVTSHPTTVNVQPGATVTNSGPAAITVNHPSTSSSNPAWTINVFGRVDGGSFTAINIEASTSSARGNIMVAPGGAITGAGAIFFSNVGSGGSVFIDNSGLIAGSIGLAAGNDRIENSGTINGPIFLGAGDDIYTEIGTGRATGLVDGGAGFADLYRVILTGDRNGLSTTSGFELLTVSGSGTLTATLSQAFETIRLLGVGLDLRVNGFTSGQIIASDAVERVTLDGSFGLVDMGGGDDFLTVGGRTITGFYTGGAGSDTLRFSGGAVQFNGTATNFEFIELDGPLSLGGTLFTAPWERLSFGSGDQIVDVVRGPITFGNLAGNFDFGAGNDRLTMHAGTSMSATTTVTLGSGDDEYVEIGAVTTRGAPIDGGIGNDLYRIVLTSDRGGISNVRGFERIAVSGSGTLTTALTAHYQSISLEGVGLVLHNDLWTVNTITGSDAAERLTLDRPIKLVDLGGGDDMLVLRSADISGAYLGGSGFDTLYTANTASLRLTGTISGFEQIHLYWSRQLSVAGTLGADGDRMVFADNAFRDGVQSLILEQGGRLLGHLDFGAGDDVFTEIGTGRAMGLVNGGGGDDLYRIVLAGNRNGLSAVTGFERLAVSGSGTLLATLPQSFQSIALAGVGLDLRLNGFTVGEITGTDGVERLGLDGNVDLVSLGGGDDAMLLGQATITGTYLGGSGSDTLFLSGGGAIRINGTVSGFEHILLSAPLVVAGTFGAAGESASFDGFPQSLAVLAGGRLLGTIDLGAGNDLLRVEGNGAVLGQVALGEGDDLLLEVGAGPAGGSIDGGAGSDLYQVVLAGDRNGLSTTSGFEELAVSGSGTLTGTLSQGFETVALFGTGLDLRLNGFTVGQIVGSDAAESVTVDGYVALVSLGGGDDLLAIRAGTASGTYFGGAGTDTLRLGAAGPVLLSGIATGFENVDFEGALTVSGILGGRDEQISFGGGAQSVNIAQGGRLIGNFDLGAGDDRVRFAAGAMLSGTMSGGAGTDLVTIELAGNMALGFGWLTDFELLATEGAGALLLSGGAFRFDRVDSAGDLWIGADASLAAPQLVFGAADNLFAIGGRFEGSVDGGDGSDTIEVMAGTENEPVAFGSVAGFEAFRMGSGFATITGQASLGLVDLYAGRLVGLAGSTIDASTILVREGATFGSAGTVNGNLLVAGILSPGASPGTMTVNGDVALGGTSTTVFELTPSAKDMLNINGSLAIYQGATLELVVTSQVAAGTSFNLITASGGISGAFSNIIKPDWLFGFLVQDANGIRLLGQFPNDPADGPQVGRTVDYANALLASGQAEQALLDFAPLLVSRSGTTYASAFATIAPEAYASLTQAAVENGLTLASAGRGAGFASNRATPGLFTFGDFSAGQRSLGGDAAEGTSRSIFASHAILGGLGYQGEGWSIGAFGGYLDGRQEIDALGTRSEIDGAVVGLHARLDHGPLAVRATAAYAATEGSTTRSLPDQAAFGRYGLDVWTFDVAAAYDVSLGTNWALRPRIGGTLLLIDREAVQESGGSVFAAQVAAQNEQAAFIDGGLMLVGGTAPGATIRPFASLGLRYQLSGDESVALAGFGGGGLGLMARGADRAQLVASAALGAEVDVTRGVTLYGLAGAERGENDRQERVQVGLRLAF